MVHITLGLSYGCIVCDNFQKASITMQFHKEINHKNSYSKPFLHIGFVEVSDYSERKCPQLFEAPPEPQLYGLVRGEDRNEEIYFISSFLYYRQFMTARLDLAA